MPLIRRHGSHRVHVMPSGSNTNKPDNQPRPQTASMVDSHHTGQRLPQHPNANNSHEQSSTPGARMADTWHPSDTPARSSERPFSATASPGMHAMSASSPWRTGPATPGNATIEDARTSNIGRDSVNRRDMRDVSAQSGADGGGRGGDRYHRRHSNSNTLAKQDTEKLDGVRRVVGHGAGGNGHRVPAGPREIYVTVHLMVEDAASGFCVEDADVAVFSRGNIQLGTAYSSDTGEAIFGLVFLGPETISFTVAKPGYETQRKTVNISDSHDQTSLRVTLRLTPIEISAWLRARVTPVGSDRALRGCRIEVYRTLDSKKLVTQPTATGEAACLLHLGGAETLTVAASKEGYISAAKSVRITEQDHGGHVGVGIELQPSGINTMIRVSLRSASDQPGEPPNALNSSLDPHHFVGTRITIRRTDGTLVALMTADEQGTATCSVYMLEPCFCEAHVTDTGGFADSCLPFEVGRQHDGQTIALAMSMRPTQADVRLVLNVSSRSDAKAVPGALLEVLEVPALTESSGTGGGRGDGWNSADLATLVPSAELAAQSRLVATSQCSQGGTGELLLHLSINRRYLLRTSQSGFESAVQELPIAWNDVSRMVEVAVTLNSASREQRQIVVAVGRESETIGVIIVTDDTTLRQVRDILRVEQLDGTPDAYYFTRDGQKCGVATEVHMRAIECFPTLVLQPRTAVHPYLVKCTPTEVQIGWEPSSGATEYMVDVYHDSTKETYVGTFERWHMPERVGRRQECVFKFRGFQGLPLQPHQQFNFVVRPVLPGHSTKDDIVLTVRTREKAMLAVLREDIIEVLAPVLFKNKSAAIQQKSYAVLECVAEVMQLNTYLYVRVRGHSNGGKGSKHQLAAETRLSLERAEAVLRHLVMLGVPKRRLRSEGVGSKEMLYPPSSSHANLNRRIEFQLVRDQALVRSFHTSGD